MPHMPSRLVNMRCCRQSVANSPTAASAPIASFSMGTAPHIGSPTMAVAAAPMPVTLPPTAAPHIQIQSARLPPTATVSPSMAHAAPRATAATRSPIAAPITSMATHGAPVHSVTRAVGSPANGYPVSPIQPGHAMMITPNSTQIGSVVVGAQHGQPFWHWCCQPTVHPASQPSPSVAGQIISIPRVPSSTSPVIANHSPTLLVSGSPARLPANVVGEAQVEKIDQASLQRLWTALSQPEACRTPGGHSMVFPKEETLDSDGEKPDFEGRWLLDRIEGDFEAFLADIGVGWTLRKMAKGFGYGVGKQLQDISLDGDDFTLITEGGPRIISMTAPIGGEEALSTGLDGEPNYVTLSWEGSRLRTDSRNKKGVSSPPTFRFFEGDLMVVETATSAGMVVKRYFRKVGETKMKATTA
eukprot:TRINITY_DN62701_c0_g1_i1.p1 TRINITY_DN62701_c0_g1~~TRINITY_DN62701_c0_g1_i1.p1  ORF type:complete len:414 (+),score=51.64 TRINITY_DN62701_c0_g1_i1:81-1322(+)